MKYNFDEFIDRKNTSSIKYDFALERGKHADILPLWVADMDFKVADEIKEALSKSVEHAIFGYNEVKDDYYNTLANWYKTYFDWSTDSSWLVKTPGVVYAIATAISAFTNKGDSVLIQEPVYYPFRNSIEVNERKVVVSELKLINKHYEIDFEDFENKIIQNDVKLFILCSPHNPIGRVWKKEELEKIGDICLKHSVIVVSDEIHSDFVYPNYKHIVFSTIKKEFEDIAVICTAPSKTFNLAGLQISNIWIPNENLRKKFIKAKEATGYSQLNNLGLVACKSAYKSARSWLEELKLYLFYNLNFTRDYLNKNMPKISLIEPEGTYLIWIDLSKLNLSFDERRNFIEKEAGLWLDEGEMFGISGANFERINIACPRKTLESALNKLKKAYDKRGF